MRASLWHEWILRAQVDGLRAEHGGPARSPPRGPGGAAPLLRRRRRARALLARRLPPLPTPPLTAGLRRPARPFALAAGTEIAPPRCVSPRTPRSRGDNDAPRPRAPRRAARRPPPRRLRSRQRPESGLHSALAWPGAAALPGAGGDRGARRDRERSRRKPAGATGRSLDRH